MAAFCFVDEISSSQVIKGWAQIQGRTDATTVIITLHNRVLAKARACRYRHDLLAAGLGHGHYGFEAPLLFSPAAGRQTIEMFDAVSGAHFHNSPAMIDIPVLAQPSRMTPEALMGAPQGWSDHVLIGFPECLQLDVNLARLGPRRLVDVLSRFALGRWPGRDAFEQATGAIARSEISALDFFVNLLTNSMNADGKPKPLPSPYDREVAGTLVFRES